MPDASVPVFSIANRNIAPGSCETINLPVSTLALGVPASLNLRILHGARPGPVIFISAVIHGDEIIGTAIIQRLLPTLDPNMLSGTILITPAVNIFGFLQHSRYLPDRRDLNRCFPGSRKGSLAAQLAHVFMNEVIGRCSYGIDIHSAAVHRYNLPQIRIAEGDEELRRLAMAFGAPVVMEAPLRPGSMRSVAGERGVRILLMETGEALRFDRLSIAVGTAGIRRVLTELGMIAPDDALSEVGLPARSRRSLWLRAPRGGVTHRIRKSGDVVQKGELLATVTGLAGEDGEEVSSPIDGIIIGHATLPIVNQGDAMFHIAEVQRFADVGERVDAITEAALAADQTDPHESGAEQADPAVSGSEGSGIGPMLDEDEVI